MIDKINITEISTKGPFVYKFKGTLTPMTAQIHFDKGSIALDGGSSHSEAQFFIKRTDRDENNYDDWIRVYDFKHTIGHLYSSFSSDFFYQLNVNEGIDPYGPYLMSTSDDNALRYLEPDKMTGADDGRLRIIPQILKTPPTLSSDDGYRGEIAIDDEYLYVCTSKDSWKRVGLSAW